MCAIATSYGAFYLGNERVTHLSVYHRGAWSAVQLEREFLRLEGMATRYSAMPEEFPQKKLLTQMELFWSRLEVILDSPDGEFLQQADGELHRELADLRLLLPGLERELKELRPHDPKALSLFLDGLGYYRNVIRDTVQFATHDYGYSKNRVAIEQLNVSTNLLFAGGVITTIVILLVVIWQHRSYRNAELTRESLQEQLHHSQKMESLGRLAGGIAHDFNNILAVIHGNIELLHDDVRHQPEQARMANNIRGAADRASQLVSQILRFSRAELMNRHRVDLPSVVTDTANMLHSTLPAGVTLDVKVDAEGYIEGDETEASQVVMNLAVNAFDAVMGRAGGTVQIHLDRTTVTGQLAANLSPPTGAQLLPSRFTADPSGGGQLWLGALPACECFRVSVHDNGSGIPSEVMKQMFEPFFTTKGPNRGTGLGLSVVLGIIKSHKGALMVSSTPGVGSAFHVLLPILNTADEARGGRAQQFSPLGSPCAPNPVSLQPEARAPREGLTILLVDDEIEAAAVAAKQLERRGYEVVTSDGGTDALDILNEAPELFAAVVTDYLMPGMNGLDLARRVREKCPMLPIILCSGFVDGSIGDEARDIGIFDVLNKPVPSSLLADRLGAAIVDADRGGPAIERDA